MSLQDMMEYRLKISQRDAAKQEYNRASLALDLARIRERLAEIKSQSKPLDTITDNATVRDNMWRVAFYVVHGRFPAESA